MLRSLAIIPHRLLSICTAVLVLVSLGHAENLSNASAGYEQIDKLYSTRTPIVVGQVMAINGRKLPEPACLLIVAGTYISNQKDPKSPLPLQAGILQDAISGPGGLPLRTIMQILISPNNPVLARIPAALNLPGALRGYNNYTFAIETALKQETTFCHPGSKLVVIGHSLGALELQRIISGPLLKDLGLELIEADFFGSPELKALPDSARRVTQFFNNLEDPIAYFPEPDKLLRNAGVYKAIGRVFPFPELIANALLPYDTSRTLSDEIRDLTQDWQIANAISIPSNPHQCGPIYNHTDGYKDMATNIPLAPIGPYSDKDNPDAGSKTIANLHPYLAAPTLDEILLANTDRSCLFLKGSVEYTKPEPFGSDIVKKWQKLNSRLPLPPKVPLH